MNALSTNLSSNLGADVMTFFSGFITDGSLRIAGSSFFYDPSAGNLLLEVQNVSGGNQGSLAYSTSSVDGTSRAFMGGPSGTDVYIDDGGLITTFETSAAGGEPSPPSPSAWSCSAPASPESALYAGGAGRTRGRSSSGREFALSG